jgi:hypothetical protein
LTSATVELSETNGDVGSPNVTDGITNLNFGDRELTKIKVTTKSEDLKVIACPTEIKVSEIVEIKLAWAPHSGKNLFENIKITGKFSRLDGEN